MIFIDRNNHDFTQVLMYGDISFIEVIDHLPNIKDKPLIVYAETVEPSLELVRRLPIVNKFFPSNFVKIAVLMHHLVTSSKTMKVMNLYSSYINKADIKIFDCEREAKGWLVSPSISAIKKDGFNRFFCMVN